MGDLTSRSLIKHILTVDVEDYFHVEAFADTVRREVWDQFPSRVVENCQRLLDLLDRHQTKATFFVLGWVAERFPKIVQEIHQRGHELACHSFWHRRVDSLTPRQFRLDTCSAREAIEQAASVKITGYRAPTWSVTKASLWALEILAEEGFAYDSSIYPVRHDLYGIPGAQRYPHLHVCQNKKRILEFPPATLRLAGMTLPAAGGGYLRIFPLQYTQLAFRQFENQEQSLVLYLHPWELDPEQPRLSGRLKSRFRHYTNLRQTESRLTQLLQRYSFESFRDHLARNPHYHESLSPVLTRQAHASSSAIA